MSYIVIWSGGYDEPQVQAFDTIDLATDAYNSQRDELDFGDSLQLFSVDGGDLVELATVARMHDGVLV